MRPSGAAATAVTASPPITRVTVESPSGDRGSIAARGSPSADETNSASPTIATATGSVAHSLVPIRVASAVQSPVVGRCHASPRGDWYPADAIGDPLR